MFDGLLDKAKETDHDTGSGQRITKGTDGLNRGYTTLYKSINSIEQIGLCWNSLFHKEKKYRKAIKVNWRLCNSCSIRACFLNERQSQFYCLCKATLVVVNEK